MSFRPWKQFVKWVDVSCMKCDPNAQAFSHRCFDFFFWEVDTPKSWIVNRSVLLDLLRWTLLVNDNSWSDWSLMQCIRRIIKHDKIAPIVLIVFVRRTDWTFVLSRHVHPLPNIWKEYVQTMANVLPLLSVRWSGWSTILLFFLYVKCVARRSRHDMTMTLCQTLLTFHSDKIMLDNRELWSF